jgi:hypothetical protein
MTPAGFLEMDPDDHPDFVPCDDPRCGSRNKAGRKDPAVFLPNLVELIRRIGGPGGVPDTRDGAEGGPLELHLRGPWEVCSRDGGTYAAMLKDKRSGRVHAELCRIGDRLMVQDWHPRQGLLHLIFTIPADWSASAWELPFTARDDDHSASYDLDRLAAEALDYRLGALRKSTETYIHVRRDRFVF